MSERTIGQRIEDICACDYDVIITFSPITGFTAIADPNSNDEDQQFAIGETAEQAIFKLHLEMQRESTQ
jgi:hypothetical protein